MPQGEVKAVITTAPSGDAAEARELAARFGLRAEERAGRTLPELLAGGAPVLVLGSSRADLYAGGRTFRASAGMAHLRVLRARKGEIDPLVRAAQLQPGERVLDCTLGLGGDSLVAAQAVGPEGSVLGLEASPLLAAFTLAGLRRLAPPVDQVARRIEVRCADHRDGIPEGFDVILFDPMFRAPLEAGPLFELLRQNAEHAPLGPEHLDEARRKARRGVLVKDAWPGRELGRLGLRPLEARRAPRIVFGWAGAG